MFQSSDIFSRFGAILIVSMFNDPCMVCVPFFKGFICQTKFKFFVAICIIRNMSAVNNFWTKIFTIQRLTTFHSALATIRLDDWI